MSATSIPIPVLAYYLGIHRATAVRMASAGKFGPLVHKPGARRYREVSLAEMQRRFGPLDQDRLARATELHGLLLILERRQKAASTSNNRGSLEATATQLSEPPNDSDR